MIALTPLSAFPDIGRLTRHDLCFRNVGKNGREIEAGRRAERLSGHGDAVGQALWLRVGRAIHDLTSAKAEQKIALT